MRRLPVPAALLLAALAAGPAHAGSNQLNISATLAGGFNPTEARAPATWDVNFASVEPSHVVRSLNGQFPDTPELTATPAQWPKPGDVPARFEFVCKNHPSMLGAMNYAPFDTGEATSFPIFDADGAIKTATRAQYTLGGAAAKVVPDATLTQPGDAADDIQQVTAKIAGGAQQGDVLAAPSSAGVSVTWAPAAQTLTLEGNAGARDEAEFLSVLHELTFATTSTVTGTRRVVVAVTDGQTGGVGKSAPDVREVEVKAPASTGGDTPTPGGGGQTDPPPAGEQPQQPGGGERPNPTGDGRDAVPPPVSRLKRTLTVDGKGRLTVVFTTTPNATGTVQILLPAVQRPSAAASRRLATGSFRANARGRVSVRVRVGAAGRRAIKRRAKRKRVGATLAVRTSGGTTTRSITLRLR